MKIYFCGSVTGGRQNAELYPVMVGHLKKYGKVLTEHLADKNLSSLGESNLSPKEVHDRDVAWLDSADVVVADVSVPSLGVGYELGRIFERNLKSENKKKMLCLYKKQEGKRLSGMISGCGVEVREYSDFDEAKIFIDEFFDNLTEKMEAVQ